LSAPDANSLAYEAGAYAANLDLVDHDPTDPTILQGPQVSAKQRDRVMSYIQKGIDEGANLVVGGHRPESARGRLNA